MKIYLLSSLAVGILMVSGVAFSEEEVSANQAGVQSSAQDGGGSTSFSRWSCPFGQGTCQASPIGDEGSVYCQVNSGGYCGLGRGTAKITTGPLDPDPCQCVCDCD
jgi:hypothetical protein